MKTIKYIAIITVLSLIYGACNTSPGGGGMTNGEIRINYADVRQEIDGFGGSNAWTRLPGDDDAADKVVKLLYSKTEGMGFTILRNRIPFRERLPGDDNPSVNDGFVVRKSDNTYDYTTGDDGVKTFNLNWNSWDLSSTRRLISRIKELGEDGPESLCVMSSPWTTPNNRVSQWKEDVTGVSATLNAAINWSKPDEWGRLKRDKYNDYADLLADYAGNFQAKMGAPLAILSVQNEPNWKVQYESTYWNGADIRDFLGIIADRFPLKGVDIAIMAPEYENFGVNFNTMIQPSLDDPKANSVLTHIALHQYNANYDTSGRAGAKAFPQIAEAGKRFWQTEVSGSGPQTPKGTGIDNALFYAKMVHYDMTLAQTNAFLYWWLWLNDSDGDFLGSLINVQNEDKVIAALRLYAMGQYSRFVRPQWQRIEATPSPTAGVYASAYRNPAGNEIAVVIINEANAAKSVVVNLETARFMALDTWRTSAAEQLAPLGRVRGIQRTGSAGMTVQLPPKSISTFYGTVSQ